MISNWPRREILWSLSIGLFLFTNCDSSQAPIKKEEHFITAEQKIVSLKGAYSDIIASLGASEQIVGTDVTSTYPTEVAQKPKVGHIRNISAEGVISLNPDIIFLDPTEISQEVRDQFQAAGKEIVAIEQEYTVEGTKTLIKKIARVLNADSIKAQKLISKIDAEINNIKQFPGKPKVLFIYARGTGTLLVAGDNTQMKSMIEIAGGENAVSGFNDFKPLTAESLIEANPDVILMFSGGMASLNGMDGILEIPGIANTNAGKNKSIITMEGNYLASFGSRLGTAALDLNQRLSKLIY